MNDPRYNNNLDDLSRGDAYGIFVDDTGSPGLTETPGNLHPDRKSWVAVIVPPDLLPEVIDEFPRALEGLREQCGADEFHFTDILNRRRQFKDVELQMRLGLFRFMGHIFSTYRFPIIAQTFDPETREHFRAQCNGRLPDQISEFDLSKEADAALLFLLIRLKWFMEQTPSFPDVKARVFIDEGFRKDGGEISIPNFDDVFEDGLVCFAKSSSIFPIQLADFAAFCLNRSQLVGGRDVRGSLDNSLLEILSSIDFNLVNIEKKSVSLTVNGPLIKLSDVRPHGPR